MPAHRPLRAAIAAAGGAAGRGDRAGVDRGGRRSSCPTSDRAPRVHALAVEPLHAGADAQERYADVVLARLQEIVVARQIAALKSRLQRINPIETPEEHAACSAS